MINKILINISIHFFLIYCICYSARYKTRVFISSLDIRQDLYQDETDSI